MIFEKQNQLERGIGAWKFFNRCCKPKRLKTDQKKDVCPTLGLTLYQDVSMFSSMHVHLEANYATSFEVDYAVPYGPR